MLSAFHSATFRSLTIAADAHVVFNWILSGEIKTNKNVFAKNRLKDVLMFIDKLKADFGFKVNFRYVPTGHRQKFC